MPQHKFTIIIPTRERADTLYWCLKTCVAQDYENLEILVSDNFSQDNTREVVASFEDKRIRYINTGRRVEMSENWDFAMKHVTEGYVGFLGDDDGCTINSISFINETLNKIPAKAIVWKEASYGWANLTNQYRDSFYVNAFDHCAEIKNARRELKRFEKNKISYKQLVSIYPNGFVLIDSIKKYLAKPGMFFRCTSPDLFSAILLANLVDFYVYINIPLSVSGSSAKSNASANKQVLQSFLEENKINSIHASLGGEFFPSWSFLLADSNFHVNEFIGKIMQKAFVKATVYQVIESTIKEYVCFPADGYQKAAAKMRQLATLHSINTNKIEKLLLKYPNSAPISDTNIFNSRQFIGWENNILTLEASKIQIAHIYDACAFLSQLTEPRISRVRLIRYPWVNKILLEASRLFRRFISNFCSRPLV